MAIDILTIQPSTISRDLRGKFVAIYSKPKVGKTSLACQFPKNLLLGFEHGWNAISGAKAVDIDKWATFKLILRQLEKPEAKEMYNTITIDTIAIAWDLCEQYICAQHSVSKIGDIPWGGGYAACQKEMEACLRKITQLGYGLVIISHEERRTEIQSNGSEVEIVAPKIPKRCYDVVNQLVDIIGYIDQTWNEDGTTQRVFYTRRTPTIMAGSRYKYLATKIPFGYDELVNAIADAIDKQEKEDGAVIVDKAQVATITDEMTFQEIRKEASELWATMVGAGETEEQQDNARIIMKKVEMVFGHPTKLSEITENQKDLFYLVLLEMRDYAEEIS